MRNLRLIEMLIYSAKEKKARKIKFHKQLTVILGKNDTGKSVLIKTIYHTFGANVKFDDKWENAATSSLVRFTVDQVPYSIIRWGKLFGLFDHSDKLIGTFESITSGLAQSLAELFDFKMIWNDRGNKPTVLPPAYYLLPYYIDQDRSWGDSWSSFENLSQFDKWRSPLIEYHTGLKPNEYYIAKSEQDILKDQAEEKRKEIVILKNLLSNIEKAVSSIDFNRSISAFEKEVNTLIEQSSTLQKSQLQYKKKITELYSTKINLESQLKVVSSVLNEIRKDLRFTVDVLQDTVDCPTCGAHYENSFKERFSIAEDENKCFELSQEISQTILSINVKIKEEKIKLEKINKDIYHIENTLSVTREEIALRDIIENEGKKQMENAFILKIEDISDSYLIDINRLSDLEKILKSYNDKERRNQIIGYYRSLMKKFTYQLDVNLADTEYERIDCRIGGLGSAKPRGLLSYYYAILHTIRLYGSSTFCPVIIDEPDQQGQDDINMPNMLSFIIDNKPKDAQLILGLQDTVDIKYDGITFRVDKKHSVLNEEDFEDVKSYITPFIEKVLGSNNDLFGLMM